MTPRAKEKYTLRMGGSGGLSRHAKAGCLFLFLTLAFLGLGLFAEDVEAKKAQVKDKRAAGTLLLNMLTMNEAQNLDRTLPVWAKIIDYWIIGIDRKNSDNSEEVIRKHVGHIPGEIVVVDFDGMGPTWTVLVKRGIEAFPGATHGIIADADFTPLVNTLDKRDLDVLCSKHLYHVIEADRTGTRTIDWMYRNIPGARVERRTHQIVQVPGIPGQPEYQRVIPFTVEEYAGGWGDRAGNKSGKYIEWLMKDLEELPGDSRTIYYLGKEHFELMGADPAKELREGGPGAYHLHKSLEYYKLRSKIVHSNLSPGFNLDEERYWAMLKAAEICERWLRDYECSKNYWLQAWEVDPPRADAVFYIGQHYRLQQDGKNASKYLREAAKLQMPTRKNYQWPYLYTCLRHLELLRAASPMVKDWEISSKAWKDIKTSHQAALKGCPKEDLEGNPKVAWMFSEGKKRRQRSKEAISARSSDAEARDAEARRKRAEL